MSTTADVAETTDALVQATAGALAVLPIGQIHPHPKNIRHNAVADDELVESIRAQGLLQPLVVAPIPGVELGDDPGPAYRLIAGHRRLDGVRKAGGDHATVIIRRDLTDEADQVAAMLVENCRRADLSPIEEAEGYGQLRFDFGWKPGQIAKAAGHTVDTVNKRLRLLKLNDKVKGNVDQGDLTLDDALALTHLPAAEQTHLTKYAGTASFKHELTRAKEKVKAQAATDQLVGELKAQGIEQREVPKGVHGVSWLTHAEHGMTPLHQTFSRDRDQHVGCLAFVLRRDHTGAQAVDYVCTNVPAHTEQLDKAIRAKLLEQEEAERAAAAERDSERIARTLRYDAIRGAIKPGAKNDPILVALIRLAAEHLLGELSGQRARIYFELAEVEEDARWGVDRLWDVDDQARFAEHRAKEIHGSLPALIRAFTALVVSAVEATSINGLSTFAACKTLAPRANLDVALTLLDLAEEAGHHETPIDQHLRAIASGEEA
ncbi:ParB/RepB/Spo0J family partition protein [Nocardioides sp. WV_118_6]